jgi:hypothetical protein
MCIIIARSINEDIKVLNKGGSKSYPRDDATKVTLSLDRPTRDTLKYSDMIASGIVCMYVCKGQDTCSVYPRRCTVKAVVK